MDEDLPGSRTEGKVLGFHSMNYRRIFMTCFLFGISVVFILTYPFLTLLEVRNFTTGQLLRCSRMMPGEEFGVSYIHSVNKRPVFDTFRVENDSLVIVKSRFDTFGAGMPDQSTEEGTLSISSDGWMEWTVNRKIPEVILRVGRIADHRLHVKGTDTRFSDLIEPGMPVHIRLKKQGILMSFKNRCI
ncbi:MAG: DUF1850 domain-containing protein [Thermodesulfobacteriota bacterium]